MKQKLLTKMKVLLVAAGLGVGSSAWADWTTVYENDYTNADTYAKGWTNGNTGRISWGQWTRLDLNESVIDKTAMRIYQNCSSNGSNASFTGLSSVSSYTSSEHYKIEFDFGLTTNNSQTPSFVIYAADNSTVLVTFQGVVGNAAECTYTTKAGNTGKFYCSNYTYNSYKLTDGSPTVFNHVVIEADETNGTKITVSSSETEEATVVIASEMLYVGKMQYNSARYMGAFAIDNMNVSIYSEEEIVPNPSAECTGVNGTERTVTMTLGTGSANGTVIKYYTDTDLKSDLTTYVNPITVSSTSTIYYYSESSSGAKSDEQSIVVTCEEITLNTPSLFISGVIADGLFFNAIFDASYNASGVEFTPSATLSATFTPDGGAETNVSLPYTATQKGTLKVTANAEGFTSASNTIEVGARYAQSWQSVDFSSVTGDNITTLLGNDWTLLDDHGRWASWAVGTYNFYQYSEGGASTYTINEKIRMRGVVVLAEGRGLGRNVTGSESVSVVSSKGQIVKFEIYNGYGAEINKGTNTHFSYGINAGANPSIGVNNGSLIVQATIYEAVPENISVTIASSGYSSVASAYALDFAKATTTTDNADALTAYVVTNITKDAASLSSIAQAPAATGVILTGTAGATYSIPVIASAEAPATNYLQAAVTATPIEANEAYILQGGLFHKVTAPSTVPAGKAYLLASNVPSEARSLNFLFADNATGITGISSELQNGEFYNLQGQRVETPTKGLYIVNGTKVIIK